MKKIVISPFSKKLINGEKNPKNYPYWEQVIADLKSNGYYIIQVGISDEQKFANVDEYKFDLSLKDLQTTIETADTWISVDNFFQHLCASIGKKGIVIFSQSDPKIFGYSTNINLLKHEKFLRTYQFHLWSQAEYNLDAFVEPKLVVNSVLSEG